MNSVQIKGNLARDPVVRATKTGRAVASFTVAVNRNYTTPQGEVKEITDWVNVVAWGTMAEAVGNHLKKGDRCFVEGRFTTRSYDTQDGQRRWVSEVTANFIAVPLGGKTDAASQLSQPQAQVPNPAPDNRGYDQFGPRYNEPQPMKQESIWPSGGSDAGEDIPF